MLVDVNVANLNRENGTEAQVHSIYCRIFQKLKNGDFVRTRTSGIPPFKFSLNIGK